MKSPIRITLTPQEAEIIAELFSDGEAHAIAELLAALPGHERHRLSRKITAEIENHQLNIISARAYLEGRTQLHIEEPEEPENE